MDKNNAENKLSFTSLMQSSERRLCLIEPHVDVENAFPRQAIPYYMVLPSYGINEETGLILSIGGYGGLPSDPYDVKLRAYLSDKYNCVVASVEYFGIHMKRLTIDKYVLSDDFLAAFETAYNGRLPDMSQYTDAEIISLLSKVLTSQGVSNFDPSIKALYDEKDCYQSFGILPVLDHMQVLAELLNLYPINKKRLYILGTSYGGYIAAMIGKLAPNTFHLIMDNSGFVQTKISDTVGSDAIWTNVSGCQLATVFKTFWSHDPESPHYFDQHHAEIRSLLEKEHIHPSKTFYYCAHSQDDTLIPIEDKIKFKDLRENFCEVVLDIVDEHKIDGRLYKNLKHGMDASLRGFFDKGYACYMAKMPSPNDQTDFDLASEYHFPCSNGFSYNIKFSQSNLCLTLTKNSCS